MTSTISSTAVSLANSASRAVTSASTASPSKTQQQLTPSQSTPQTPKITPQPGTWKHPRMDEIARRQNAGVFNKDNINRAIFNGGMLLLSFILPALASNMIPYAIKSQIAPFEPYQIYPYLLVRLYFLIHFLLAFRPLYLPKDEMNDIPLTPSQRALLGLKPTTAPYTPGGAYITPPRYSRSATPQSSASRAGSQSSYSGSPLANRGRSDSMDRSFGPGSKGGPNNLYGGGSPLVQKALSESTSRRLSFDSASVSSGLPNTPTPAIGTGRASVGLNSKWLYERGRGSPTGRGLFA